MDEIVLTLHSEKDTQALAVSLAKQARVGDIIYLKGTLGMGKSTFARAFIRHLADNPHIEVPSPTFTLVQSYTDLSLPVWHFDLYRLNSPEEIEELGLDEALSTAVSLIEWPERLGRMTFSNTLVLALKAGKTPDEREVRLSGDASWNDRLNGVSL
ncbi:MAG: tRNA (adenosine(37)-N6)-threonylcarbamoyltransferase complex ATPase subunit type 1 TsaE [Alphaproteobacteria bacterium]|nr:tRNA (adenosine(37)-N6)-threonylcarbamoyltransferase complex ATPase subunit type 1 TsaE [Alphaproteobacteria bacterium]NCQ66166.1 tRNA (adenosine(37)-N6)-threonylcarbamoyltransferase complex ATPase subunit type 1 TsaE [Alphaproteobacteria bacterium]NCT06514.1 tRNA (adenosine(37)-N6)-threonylcarbamoyltransferase complex ATPase subunit type 1 TsaE [Alphaproteobacteria bacterium]